MNQNKPSLQVVLHADDDPDDIQLVKEAFGMYTKNVDVVSVHDGTAAIAWLRALGPLDTKPCLIILDINMPKMDGKETLQRIRALPDFDKVPILLFTTSTRNYDQDFAMRYNAGFLTKPIDDRQMDRIINNFLSHCTEEVRNGISGRIG